MSLMFSLYAASENLGEGSGHQGVQKKVSLLLKVNILLCSSTYHKEKKNQCGISPNFHLSTIMLYDGHEKYILWANMLKNS